MRIGIVMEEGLFEKAFREKNESLGLIKKPVMEKRNIKSFSRPVIQKPAQSSSSPQKIINVGSVPSRYISSPNYARRRTRVRRKISQSKRSMAKRKRDREQIERNIRAARKAAIAGAKATGRGVKFVKNRVKRTKGSGSIKDKVKTFFKGSIY